MASRHIPKQRDDAKEILLSTEALVRLALSATDLHQRHVKDILHYAIWKRTEAEFGKYGLRLRTQRAHDEIVNPAVKLGSTIRHEHVFPRAALVRDMLALGEQPDRALAILRERAVACIVHKDEAYRLDRSDADGWERYRENKISVFEVNDRGELIPYKSFE